MGRLKIYILHFPKFLLCGYRVLFWILKHNVRNIAYYYSQIPTDFIIIFRVVEKGRYVLWPKVFPPLGRTLTINSTSTSTAKKAKNSSSFFWRVYLYKENRNFSEVFTDDTMRPNTKRTFLKRLLIPFKIIRTMF